MIDLYTFSTPNGRKPAIMLEELALPYKVHPIDIGKGAQHTPEFRRLNPNGKIPAIVDQDGPITVFESGAILIYLAEKTGRLLASSGPERYAALEWVMLQMGGVGPMLGQYGHFTRYAPEKIPYAIERYRNEGRRLLGVVDGRLSAHDYLAGAYSIADICMYPWLVAGVTMIAEASEFPALRTWLARVGQRPAVQKGMTIP
jgi:GST-like protein